jgi:low temperature requirement protein LtrA
MSASRSPAPRPSVWSPRFNTGTETAVRVSTIELFFDLVFVFTVTQLTAVLAGHTTWASLGRIALLLGITWWMYGGYAWLTNAVAPVNTVRRGLLVAGMAGFLTMAIAVPDAFGSSGWAFGAGYLLVNLVHSGLFLLSSDSRTALRSLGPVNLASALMVLAGGLVGTPARYWLWGAALALQIATPYLVPLGGFTIAAAHFVERHGLVIIVALGESVVAIGAGVEGIGLDAETVTVAVLGLILAYFVYWAYFGGDEERAEHALDAIEDPRRKSRMALWTYGYAHYPMLLGIVALAAGVKRAAGHAHGHISLGQAVALGGGVALFLVGDLAFRRMLRIGTAGYRLVGLAGALVSIPLGLVTAAGQLGLLVLTLAVPLSVEGYRRVVAEAGSDAE